MPTNPEVEEVVKNASFVHYSQISIGHLDEKDASVSPGYELIAFSDPYIHFFLDCLGPRQAFT